MFRNTLGPRNRICRLRGSHRSTGASRNGLRLSEHESNNDPQPVSGEPCVRPVGTPRIACCVHCRGEHKYLFSGGTKGLNAGISGKKTRRAIVRPLCRAPIRGEYWLAWGGAKRNPRKRRTTQQQSPVRATLQLAGRFGYTMHAESRLVTRTVPMNRPCRGLTSCRASALGFRSTPG